MAAIAPNIPTTHVSDGYRTGKVQDAVYGNGSPVSPLFVYDFVPVAASATNIFPANTISGSGTLSLSAGTGNTSMTYKGYSNVIALDSPRAISITGFNTGAQTVTSQTFVVSGWDVWGVPMTETISGPAIGSGIASSTVNGKKAFAYVRQITCSGSTGTGNIGIGTSDIFGLPYLCRSQNYVRASWDGYSDIENSIVAQGVATLSSGLAIVQTTAVKATSVLMVNYAVGTATTANRGYVYAASTEITPGAQFKIRSTNGSDTSTVYWKIVERSDYAGTAVLENGTVTVSTPVVTSDSIILLTIDNPDGTAADRGFYSVGTITSGSSFVINSSDNADGTSINWWIVYTDYSTTYGPMYMGQATLASGTATVRNGLIESSSSAGVGQSVIILSPSSLGAGTGGFLSVSASTDNTSFVITSLDTSGVNTADVSVVNYVILNAPRSIFTLPDLDTATSTTGDVRGTYQPSTASDGLKRLSITMYVRGSDPIADNYGVVNDDDTMLESVTNLTGVTQA
jgi:hypothetical protein